MLLPGGGFRSGGDSTRRGGVCRSLAATAGLVLLLAGCSSDGGDEGQPASPQAATTASSDGDASAEAPAGTDEPAEATDGGSDTAGVLVVEAENGLSWTSEDFSCTYTPDNTSPYTQVWSADATFPSGGEMGVMLANSPDPASDETLLIGTLVDEAADVTYVAIEATATAEESTLTLVLGMHDNPLRTVGDPIDLTATVTCPL